MNNYLLAFLWSIPGLLVATTMHEFVRALASSAMGDNLPKSQGRLTLNPLKHFEPIGFLLLFLGFFGNIFGTITYGVIQFLGHLFFIL